jgi:hypothetical protein
VRGKDGAEASVFNGPEGEACGASCPRTSFMCAVGTGSGQPDAKVIARARVRVGGETWADAMGLPASTGARPLPHTRTVPYRDELSANQEHVQRLTRELEETREELAELRAKYARAMAVLRVVAEGKKIEKLLEERKSVPPGSLVPEPKKP